MLRFLTILFCVLSCACRLMAQPPSNIDSILLFLGCDDLQEVDEEEVERLSSMIENPICINRASIAQLRSSGLFTPYQLAVLDDYRSRHGNVTSMLELSVLDAFGDEFTKRLKPFICIDSESGTSQVTSASIQELVSKTGYKWREDEGSDGTYAVKYRAQSSGRYSLAASVCRSAGSGPWYPETVAGTFQCQFRRIDGHFIVGDFNARFGQGLTLWNGAFMTSLASPDAFMKKPSGISQPWSFTGSTALSGMGADFALGKFVVSTMVAFPGLKSVVSNPQGVGVMPAVNVAWHGRFGQVSMTNLYQMSPNTAERQFLTGLDAAFCVKGVNIFGEVTADWKEKSVKALLGSRFRVGEYMDMAMQLRAFQKDQYGLALSGDFHRERHRVTFSTDGTYYPVSKDKNDPFSLQLKSQFLWEMKITQRLQMKIRVSERVRTWGHTFRTDVRADLSYDISLLKLLFRFNCLNCDRTGFLSYAQLTYAGDKLTLHMRQGLFHVDDWDDRIYVYEHDAPGSFNVPAMYGRGLWTSLAAGLKVSYRLRIYARAAYTGYPFVEAEKKKPSKAELKLQLQCRF